MATAEKIKKEMGTAIAQEQILIQSKVEILDLVHQKK